MPHCRPVMLLLLRLRSGVIGAVGFSTSIEKPRFLGVPFIVILVPDIAGTATTICNARGPRGVRPVRGVARRREGGEGVGGASGRGGEANLGALATGRYRRTRRLQRQHALAGLGQRLGLRLGIAARTNRLLHLLQKVARAVEGPAGR